jgi:hypothetical protein
MNGTLFPGSTHTRAYRPVNPESRFRRFRRFHNYAAYGNHHEEPTAARCFSPFHLAVERAGAGLVRPGVPRLIPSHG